MHTARHMGEAELAALSTIPYVCLSVCFLFAPGMAGTGIIAMHAGAHAAFSAPSAESCLLPSLQVLTQMSSIMSEWPSLTIVAPTAATLSSITPLDFSTALNLFSASLAHLRAC